MTVLPASTASQALAGPVKRMVTGRAGGRCRHPAPRPRKSTPVPVLPDTAALRIGAAAAMREGSETSTFMPSMASPMGCTRKRSPGLRRAADRDGQALELQLAATADGESAPARRWQRAARARYRSRSARM